MSRLNQVKSYIEQDIKSNFLIEPENRYAAIKERLFDVINTYKPEVIIKAGIGRGDLLAGIMNEFKIYTVVIEPSFQAIKDFLGKHGENDKLKFINGDFQDFPADYYAADLLICIDYLDFFDSSKCINEFKRALRFDGIIFLSTTLLNNKDIEGMYDEFMKLIFPLHNDYYLAEDISTLMKLKEFSLVKNMQMNFKNNLLSKIDFFRDVFNTDIKEQAMEFISTHKDEFREFMQMNENYDISEPYYIGVYMRNKPEESKNL